MDLSFPSGASATNAKSLPRANAWILRRAQNEKRGAVRRDVARLDSL